MDALLFVFRLRSAPDAIERLAPNLSEPLQALAKYDAETATLIELLRSMLKEAEIEVSEPWVESLGELGQEYEGAAFGIRHRGRRFTLHISANFHYGAWEDGDRILLINPPPFDQLTEIRAYRELRKKIHAISEPFALKRNLAEDLIESESP
ncbi:MAG: hypothetical protein ACR2RV_11050 [Verrucomicrobiales bacterium]